MHIYNNLDVRRAVLKLFGSERKHSIKSIEKIGDTFRVYLEYARLEPSSELPDGVHIHYDGKYTIVVFEKRDVEVV